MTIQEITKLLEIWAPIRLAESYDNPGLIIGDPNTQVRGILICLDSTEEVIQEAIDKGCNLIVAHHPIIFQGLKKLNGANYVERAVMRAIQHKIALYAFHTNLDNILNGVNFKIAHLLGLHNLYVLQPHAVDDPSLIMPNGAGVIGDLVKPSTEKDFLQLVKKTLQLQVIRHSAFTGKQVTRVALCGGSGGFLIPAALKLKADIFLTADLKYHQFFNAEGRILLGDVGHWESERFTIDQIHDYLMDKSDGTPLVRTSLNTNPVQYFL